MTTTTTVAPESPRVHVNKWLILGLVCLAQFMVVLDATVVNVSLRRIQQGLNFAPADLQLILTAYAITFGGFMLLGGRAGDLFGRQTIFLVGLVIFTAASIFDGFAQSPTMLIIGRAAQGFGGALISPAALSIITTTFDEGPDRNKALGVWSGIAASGAAFGLLIGGALTEWINWRWAFFVNGPVGVLAFVFALRMVPNSRLHGQRGLDILGASTVTGGLMAIVYALSRVTQSPTPTAAVPHPVPYGWTDGGVVVAALIGVVLLAAFLVTERLTSAPIVRLSIFTRRSLSMSNLSMFLVAGGMFAMFFFSSIYVQQVLNYQPFTAGLAFLPVCFGIGIGAGIASQAVKSVDTRYVAALGMFIAAGGYLLLSRIGIDSSYWGVLFPALMIMSVGMGLTFVPITLVATTNIEADDAGLASGLLNTSQQVGGALGLAILSTIAFTRTNDYVASHASPNFNPQLANLGLIEGFRLAFIGGAGLLVISAVVTIVLLRARDVAGIREAAKSGAIVATPAA